MIENNYLEATGENLMFGGGDPKIVGLVPSDITLRMNHLVKPRSWQQPIIGTPTASASPVAGGTLPAGTYGYRVVARRSVGQGGMGTSLASVQVSATLGAPGAVRVSWAAVPNATEYRVYGRAMSGPTMYWKVTGTSFVDGGAAGTSGTIPVASYWTVKNLFELKNARRVLAEGNVLEQNWTDGQNGIAITFKPSNQGTAPWTEVSDVTFRYNIVRHAGGGINITGYGYNGLPASRRETFRSPIICSMTSIQRMARVASSRLVAAPRRSLSNTTPCCRPARWSHPPLATPTVPTM